MKFKTDRVSKFIENSFMRLELLHIDMCLIDDLTQERVFTEGQNSMEQTTTETRTCKTFSLSKYK